jgi:hypothetical protein
VEEMVSQRDSMMFSIDLTERKTSVKAVRLDNHGAVVLSLVAVDPNSAITAELVLAMPAEVLVQVYRQLHGKLPEIQ